MLKEYLINNWRELTGDDTPSSFQLVPLSSCLHDYGNDLVLIFTDNSSTPNYVMKISRSPKYSFKLKREYSVLSSLKEVENLAFYLPYPSFLGESSGLTFFIQKGISGTSLFEEIGKRGVAVDILDLLYQSIDLLCIINSTNNLEDLKTERVEVFSDLINQHVDNLVSLGLEKRFIDRINKESSVFLAKGNVYFQHGDYWQTNIMVQGNGINGIIDWEFAVPRSNIPADIIWFLINLGHCLHMREKPSATIPESFRWAFLSEGRHNDILWSCYDRYAKAMGFDRDVFKTILMMTLIKMSIREFSAYGDHKNMDYVCMDMLKLFMENE